VVPHGHPLEDEEVNIIVHASHLHVIAVIRLVPGVLHARSDVSKVSRCDPLVFLLENKPHDAAHDVRIYAEEEREEGDLCESLRLNFQVGLANVLVHLPDSERFEQLG